MKFNLLTAPIVSRVLRERGSCLLRPPWKFYYLVEQEAWGRCLHHSTAIFTVSPVGHLGTGYQDLEVDGIGRPGDRHEAPPSTEVEDSKDIPFRGGVRSLVPRLAHG